LPQPHSKQFDGIGAYLSGVLDHTKVHAALKNDIASAKDPEIKALVTKLEPIVAQHLEMAKKLDASIK
jgi:putative membrane protein